MTKMFDKIRACLSKDRVTIIFIDDKTGEELESVTLTGETARLFLMHEGVDFDLVAEMKRAMARGQI